jgi:hypothetical protein
MSANIDSNLSTVTPLASHGSAVWVQLYYKGEDEPASESYMIESIPGNVSLLKESVKKYFSIVSPAAAFKAYQNGIPLDPGDQVPAGTTSRTPLIVIAPKSDQPNGKLRCCSAALLLFSYSFIVAFNLFEYKNRMLTSTSCLLQTVLLIYQKSTLRALS